MICIITLYALIKKNCFPPEVLSDSVLHHETGETWHSGRTSRPGKAFSPKGKNIPATVKLFGYWYYLFWSVGSILICNPERMGQKQGRKWWQTALRLLTALGFETTWIISSQDILSRNPTSV